MGDDGVMDAEIVSALVSDEGQKLLESLPPYRENEVVRLTAALRAQGYDAALVAAALTQSRLRQRAVAKLGPEASAMLFTPDALEQASRAVVAQRHAQRMVAAGVRRVVDAGCGIGADARAFAQAGLPADAIELDPATAQLARFNLREADTATVHCLDAQTFTAPPDAAWWFDPARRVSGVADITGKTKRTFSLAALTPSWEFVQQACASGPAGGAKLSPSFPHAEIPAACEAEFVSYNGDVVECALWWGAAARTRGRSATIISQRTPGDASSAGTSSAELAPYDSVTVTETDAVDAPAAEQASDLGEYLYEADKALTRSALVGALVAQTGGVEIQPGYGYVSSDALVETGILAKRYRVHDILEFNPKQLRSYLRERQIGNPTIKKRGVSIDDKTLRQQLKLKGKNALTLTLTQIAGQTYALVVEPVPAR